MISGNDWSSGGFSASVPCVRRCCWAARGSLCSSLVFGFDSASRARREERKEISNRCYEEMGRAGFNDQIHRETMTIYLIQALILKGLKNSGVGTKHHIVQGPVPPCVSITYIVAKPCNLLLSRCRFESPFRWSPSIFSRITHTSTHNSRYHKTRFQQSIDACLYHSDRLIFTSSVSHLCRRLHSRRRAKTTLSQQLFESRRLAMSLIVVFSRILVGAGLELTINLAPPQPWTNYKVSKSWWNYYAWNGLCQRTERDIEFTPIGKAQWKRVKAPSAATNCCSTVHLNFPLTPRTHFTWLSERKHKDVLNQRLYSPD